MRKENLNPAIDDGQIVKTERDSDNMVSSSEDIKKIEKELVKLFATIIVNHVLKDHYEKGNSIFKI